MILYENVDGKNKNEIEYSYVGRLKDFNQLKQFSTEQQEIEQWSISTNKALNEGEVCGDIRVRKINKDYILTIKEHSKNNEKGLMTCIETEQTITKDMFESFRKLAPFGIVKTRYIFPIKGTDLKWELDLMIGPDGTFSDWVRLELEVDKPLDDIKEYAPPVDLEFFTSTGSKSQIIQWANREFRKYFHKNRDNILPLQR